MDETAPLPVEEFEERIEKVRSLSGCLRIIRILEEQELDTEHSQRKINLLTSLLEKTKSFSGVDPEKNIPDPHNSENRRLIRSYAILFTARCGHFNLGGSNIAAGEADARRALKLAQTIEDKPLEALALNHLGNSLVSMQRIQEGRDCFERAVELERTNGSNLGIARSLYNLARAEISLGAYRKSREAVDEALEIYSNDPALPQYGRAFLLAIRQDIHENQGKHGESLADCLRSLDLLQELEITDRLTTAHFNLVRRYLRLDQPSDAMFHASQAAEVAERTGNPMDKTLALLALSATYLRIGDLEKAQELSRQGLALTRETRHVAMECICLERLAEIARQQGNLQEAFDLLQEALKKEKHHISQAALHCHIASLLLEQGRPAAAKKELQKGIDLAHTFRERTRDVEFLLISARIARAQGDDDMAISILSSIEEHERASTPVRREAHQILADLYMERQEPDKALEHYRDFHTLSVEAEQQLAEHRLIALRAQHEVENHRREVARALELQQSITQEKERLAMEVSERQQIIEYARHLLNNAVRNLDQNRVQEGKRMLQEVLHKFQSKPASEEQWLLHLPNIDNAFLARLRNAYPGLTSGQIRLCGLLRSGFSSSDIAQRLHLSIETVTTQRKRLRKRMNLKEGENLEQILAAL